MITFIISIILVFIGVELLVRFIIEPLILGRNKKNKVSKSSTSKLDTKFRLATETMYDGGKTFTPEVSENAVKDENISKDEVKS